MKRLCLPLVLGLVACPIGNNKFLKPTELTPAWKVDKLRVLAIRADPPEIRPGEEAGFEALVIDPEGSTGAIAWIACPPEDDDGVGFGCGLNGDFDFTTASPDELAEQGFIGLEPIIPPRFVAPIDSLDDLDEIEAREGLYVLVQIAVLPQNVFEGDFGDGTEFDFNEVEVAYKRLIISDASTPNANPEVKGWTVEGEVIPPGTVVEFDPDQDYEIGIQLEDGAVQAYQYTNPEGVVEDRIEEPYVKWYASGGSILEEATLFPFLEASWRSPDVDDDESTGTFWAVVRDRRGGISWTSLSWRLQGN